MEAMLDQHIVGGTHRPGPAQDAVVFAPGAVLAGRGAACLVGTHQRPDLLGQLERQAVHIVQIVESPVHHRVVDVLRVAGSAAHRVGMQRDEHIAALGGGASVVNAEVGADVRSGGDDLKAPGLQLGLQLQVKRPYHFALIVALYHRAAVVLSKMPGVKADPHFTHRLIPPPRLRGR